MKRYDIPLAIAGIAVWLYVVFSAGVPPEDDPLDLLWEIAASFFTGGNL